MKVSISLFVSLFFWHCLSAQKTPDFKEDPVDLHVYSVTLWQNGHYDSALRVAEHLVAISSANKDSLQLAKSLNTLGIIYNSKGDPIQSIANYTKALTLFKALHSEEYLSTTLLNLGIAYKIQGDYEKALVYLLEAAESFEKANKLQHVSSAYNTVGNIFRIQKRYDKALEYHQNALSLRKKINYEKGIAGSLNNLGAVYLEMGQLDSALAYFTLSLNLKETQNLPAEKATTLLRLSEISFLQKDWKKAESYSKQSKQLYELDENKAGLSGSFYDLARIHFAIQNYALAEKECLSALGLSQETGTSTIRLKCFGLLKSIYTAKKNYFNALIYADSFIVLNEQILGEQKQKSLAQLEVKYESEKKQRELEELNREKEKAAAILLLKDLQLEAKTNYNNTLILTLVLLSVVVVLLLLLFRDRSLFAKKLDFLLRELHHRVKNNFQVLLSLFNLQLAHTNEESTRELIEGNSHRVTAMMLIHSGLYQDKDITRVRIAPYIRNLIDNLMVIYNQAPDRIQVNYVMDDDLDMEVDKSIPLGLLVNELATNAIKYAFTSDNPNPSLFIEFKKENGRYTLIFQDNGPGMDSTQDSASFGLKLANSQVKQLNGILKFEQEIGLKYIITFSGD